MNNKSENLDNIRHSLAHLLAASVLQLRPEAKLGIGPTIENGFYYDFQFPKKKLNEDDLPSLEKKMKRMIRDGLSFSGKKVTPAEARKLFSAGSGSAFDGKSQPFKLDLIKEFVKEKKALKIYKTGKFFLDLCRGGHVKKTSEISPDAFKLTHVAGAYWRGSEKNPMLTRIYGVAFNTKRELDKHLKMLEEAKERDHRKIGKELGLFVFSDVVGKGLPLWTARGSVIKRELERFIIDEEIKRGYIHVYTPDIAKLDLYRKSGHYPYYKDSMYAPIKIDDEEFMLRPMTCPHHFELYLSRPRTYRELPMRIAEVAKLYRYEQSGELSGLMRLRSFCLADAHIICKDSKEAAEEVSGALDLIEYAAKIFGLKIGKDYWYRLSLGNRKDGKKYFKNDNAWNESEKMLRMVLKDRGGQFVEAPDEAAFYGPKIDIQMRNVNGKEDTAFTVQYDFCMPERFNLTYIDKDGKDKKTIVVHRSSIGAIERTIAFLIERWAGNFPLWLSPVQTVILPVSDKQKKYGEKVLAALKEKNIRVEMPEANETLGKRIRAAELQKIPYILVVGEKEAKKKSVNMRERHQSETKDISLQKFTEKLLKEINQKK